MKLLWLTGKRTENNGYHRHVIAAESGNVSDRTIVALSIQYPPNSIVIKNGVSFDIS